MKHIVIAALLITLMVACGPAAPATPRPDTTPTGQTEGEPARPTSSEPTILPTYTPDVATATSTARPTRTPTRTLTPKPTNQPNGVLTPSGSKVPPFSHIYLIVMENKEYTDIVGKSSLPYLNSLIASYGLATNYTAVAHPSQPNYLALFSGSTQGVTDDSRHTIDAANLADQLETNGKTWRFFEEDLPSNCFTGQSSPGSESTGGYARKHNPAISFSSISNAPARCANITDLANFDPSAANFEFIVPNICNDMHSCPASTGDAFLKDFVPRVLDSPAWQDGGVLFVTWDEGTTNKGGGGQIATLVISKLVPAGTRSAVAHNHYSLLRTIQEAWGLGCLAESCSANNLGEFFH